MTCAQYKQCRSWCVFSCPCPFIFVDQKLFECGYISFFIIRYLVELVVAIYGEMAVSRWGRMNGVQPSGWVRVRERGCV